MKSTAFLITLHTITFTKCGIAYNYVRRMNRDYATTSCISVVSDLAPPM